MKSVSLVFHIEASRGKLYLHCRWYHWNTKSQRDAFPKVTGGVERVKNNRWDLDTVATLESEEYGFVPVQLSTGT